ncbi:DUF4956 domain-containing protein [Lachnospiraceae bacterium JLR.KK008]
MSFRDIIKKSVLESFTGSSITTVTVCVTLAITIVLALYIFIVYYLSARKTFYNKTFNVSLAAIAVITASIILAMQSNLAISLGMVGALSIVRFRTAVKDPKDLVFLFWSISVGIICGAGIYEIAVISSLIVTIGLFALELTPTGSASGILVVNCNSLEREKEIMDLVKAKAKHVSVRSRNASVAGVDFVIECRVKEPSEMLTKLQALDGVSGVSLLAHDGEVNF